MKKKTLIILIIAIVCLLAATVGCLCYFLIGNEDEPPVADTPDNIDLSAVTLEDLTTTYNGGTHSLSVGELPDGVSVKFYNNGKSDVGVYEVIAKFYYTGILDGESYDEYYLKNKDLTAILTINKATYDMSSVLLEDKTVVYNGTRFDIKVNENALPDGVSVAYATTGNNTDAGEYVITATFTGNPNYNAISPKTATLIISKATYDMSSVLFEDKTVVYNGQRQDIRINENDLPEGVSVTYGTTGNNTDAGEYVITATFTGNPNYNVIPQKTATLTISKATYDMSGIYFTDTEVGYDGQAKYISVTGALPDGVSVSYVGNGVSEVNPDGHSVTAIFTGDSKNYEPIPSMSAKIYILKDKLAGVTLTGQTVTFNGSVFSLEVSGLTDDSSITVEYEYNGAVLDGVRNAGSYTVVAKFYRNGVYDADLDLKANLVINKAKINITVGENIQTQFDGSIHSIDYNLSSLVGVSVDVVGNNVLSIGEHTVVFKIKIAESEKDNIEKMNDITRSIIITKGNYVTEGLVTEATEITGYNGNDIGIVIPDGITSIGSEAFKGNTSIQYVYLPDSVTSIGNNAFAGCSSLCEIRIGDKLTVIGQNAFINTALKELTLPDSLLSVGHGAFAGVPLEKLTLPFLGGSRNSSHKFLGYIFGAYGYAAQVKYVPETLKTVTVTGGGYAPEDHSECKDEYYFHVACGNPEIPPFAFYGCENIENIYLLSGITEIGNSAFQGCTGLTSIYIPASVDTIAANAYDYNSPFYLCNSDLKIYLGASTKEDYQLGENNASGKGFGRYWNLIEEGAYADTYFNTSYQDYLEEHS